MQREVCNLSDEDMEEKVREMKKQIEEMKKKGNVPEMFHGFSLEEIMKMMSMHSPQMMEGTEAMRELGLLDGDEQGSFYAPEVSFDPEKGTTVSRGEKIGLLKSRHPHEETRQPRVRTAPSSLYSGYSPVLPPRMPPAGMDEEDAGFSMDHRGGGSDDPRKLKKKRAVKEKREKEPRESPKGIPDMDEDLEGKRRPLPGDVHMPPGSQISTGQTKVITLASADDEDEEKDEDVG